MNTSIPGTSGTFMGKIASHVLNTVSITESETENQMLTTDSTDSKDLLSLEITVDNQKMATMVASTCVKAVEDMGESITRNM